ncbi:7 transmembrane receptor (Secretin family) [Popillia japonica]|uniref:7 transmembrane receptor (Secretin family) n=1 Tax=Popillia japonica TaxID=7064 RepID=A0AAW1IG10_POPJA
MAFVSYVQYARFIKVFGESHFSIPKSLTIGWGLPAIVTTASTILYMDCLKCQFCSKNDDIFLYFVIVPIILISLDLNYYNEESHIYTTNQSIIAYIQPAYLELVNHDILTPSKDDFLILITFNLHKNQIDFQFILIRQAIGQALAHSKSPKIIFRIQPALPNEYLIYNLMTSRDAENNLSYSTCFAERISYLQFDDFTRRYHKSSESANGKATYMNLGHLLKDCWLRKKNKGKDQETNKSTSKDTRTQALMGISSLNCQDMSALLTEESNRKHDCWIDSGATHHMCYTRESFKDLKRPEEQSRGSSME